jgi:ParB-like nuclease domain.
MSFSLSDLQTTNDIIKINLNQLISNSKNPYSDKEQELKVDYLADLILKEGLTNPIQVEDAGNGTYLINKGHNRVKAFRKLLASGKEEYYEIDAVIVHFENEALSSRSMIQDNASQKERSPKDKLREVRLYIEDVLPYIRGLTEFKGIATKSIIAKELAMSETAATQFMRVSKSKSYIYESVLNNELTISNAYEIAGIKDKKIMRKIFNYAKGNNLTKIKLKKLILNNGEIKEKNKSKSKPKYDYAEELIRDKLRTKTKIDQKKITIYYTGDKDLNRILKEFGLIENEGKEYIFKK